jgi:hypothetical protein
MRSIPQNNQEFSLNITLQSAAYQTTETCYTATSTGSETYSTPQKNMEGGKVTLHAI